MTAPQKPQTQPGAGTADTPWQYVSTPSLGAQHRPLKGTTGSQLMGVLVSSDHPAEPVPQADTQSKRPPRPVRAKRVPLTRLSGEPSTPCLLPWERSPHGRQGGRLRSLDCRSHKTEHPFNSEASWRSAVPCNTAALTDTCLNVNSKCQPSAVGQTYLPVHNLCSILKMGTLTPSQGKANCPGSQCSFLKPRCPLCGAESRCKRGRSQGLHFRLSQLAAWR